MPLGASRAGLMSVAVDDIPDSDMFQNPIYQFFAGSIEDSDGTSPVDYPEVLAELEDASAVDSPTFRADQDGFKAVEYDGSGDKHEWTPNEDIPTGSDPLSVAALVYHRDSNTLMRAFSYGEENEGRAFALGVEDGNVETQNFGADSGIIGSSTAPSGDWITIGAKHTGSNDLDVYLNGDVDGSGSSSHDHDRANANHEIGDYIGRGDFWDGFIAEIVVCDGDESDQAFADYHNDRLG